MSFDHSFFLGRVTPKVEATAKIMENLPHLKTVEVYEDSVHQIIQYQEFFQNKDNLEVKIYIIDKSKAYRIENLKLSEERRIVLI
jgi:hypothetical protein